MKLTKREVSHLQKAQGIYSLSLNELCETKRNLELTTTICANQNMGRCSAFDETQQIWVDDSSNNGLKTTSIRKERFKTPC